MFGPSPWSWIGYCPASCFPAGAPSSPSPLPGPVADLPLPRLASLSEPFPRVLDFPHDSDSEKFHDEITSPDVLSQLTINIPEFLQKFPEGSERLTSSPNWRSDLQRRRSATSLTIVLFRQSLFGA